MQKEKSSIIKVIRVYDAPLQLVWDAWKDVEQVGKWWGPRCFTLTTHSKDFRSGGSWHYTMHGPEGEDFENTTQYIEVEERRRLVYDHGGHRDRPPLFRVTAIFEDLAGKTQLQMAMTFPTPEIAEEMRLFIKKAGGYGTWDRLAEYLVAKQTGKDIFVIARSFDVSIERMFSLWTEERQLQSWMGPAGSSMKFIDCNIHPGGGSFYEMELSGKAVYGKVEYLEITRPHRLVYKQWFSTKEGGVGRHPLAPSWPVFMLTAVTFSEEGPNRSRISLRWEIFGDSTEEEQQIFFNAKRGMEGGWSGSFDKLEQILT